ncbi:MAG: hypothetical protein A2Y24_06560 [Clostridiales bacterium GWE2_32_10]|nr:MAG: hypothetical protein A2Y24_06560 [Clostridiales bacterium GWE2_32_10]HBY20391.1 hypothetical protein [Clostridiales bacterium]
MLNNVKVNLKILLEILQKKEILLNEIYNITINQNTVITSEKVNMVMFEEMIKEKRIRIDDINDMDEKFQNIFDNIKKDIARYKENYIEAIRELKKLINENINLKMKIELQEEKNRKVLEKNNS